MTLRTSGFNATPGSRENHISDHTSLHRAYNHAIYVDDYDSVAAAITAATNAGITRILFTPGASYDIDVTISVPAGMQLVGGGSFGIGGAILNVTAGIDAAVTLATQAGAHGIDIDGNNLTNIGFALTGDRHVLRDNKIRSIGADAAYDGVAVQCNGILYPFFERNQTQTINGWAIKGLATDGPAYYGINVGLSQMNIWAGTAGSMYLEGVFTSISDDFEMSPHVAVIKVGDIAGRIQFYTPYFEIAKRDVYPVVIEINGSGRVLLHGGSAFGDADAADRGDFVKMNSAYQLQIENMFISRFAKLVSGASANNARLVVRDCVIENVAENMPDNWNISAVAHRDLQWE